MGYFDESLENRCPECGDGYLNHYIRKEDVRYNNLVLQVDMNYSSCPNCYCEIQSPYQLAINKTKVIAAYDKINSIDGWGYI